MNARKLWNDYKTPLALGAAGLGTWALGSTLEPELVRNLGENAYNWRFLFSVPLAVAGAETAKTYWQNRLGRELTSGEKAAAYVAGAAIASTGAEGWEYLGSQLQPVQETLKTIGDTLGTDIIGKKEFPGLGSPKDAVINTASAVGLESLKHYFSKSKRK